MPAPYAAQLPTQPIILRAGAHRLSLHDRVRIMGIVNVTPDSFSDGGQCFSPDAAVARALALAEAGADIIDIGAESTRPGSEPVEEQEELRRLIPVVREVCRRISLPVSVDTQKASVARLALEAGAAIINDVSALLGDPAMGLVVAESGAGLVLMHMQGRPATMQQTPFYRDVTVEVRRFLDERARAAQACGIEPDRILLDPGIGFGKNLDHNLTLLARVPELQRLGYPILIGPSRKAFIGQVLDRPIQERAWGAAAAVAIAVLGGARVIRTHDVREMRDVAAMADALRRTKPQTVPA